MNKAVSKLLHAHTLAQVRAGNVHPTRAKEFKRMLKRAYNATPRTKRHIFNF